jgi:hypothetical protein
VANRRGIGRERLDYRFRVPDPTGSPELNEVRVQKCANATSIDPNLRIEK